MQDPTIGILIIIISLLGYLSNWLNWRFLNYKINHLLYYFGAFVHESSHALVCILVGARVSEYKVFAAQPRVSYTKPKLPIIGNLLISIAPMLGGLALLYFLNKYFLINEYILPSFSNYKLFLPDLLSFLKQINIFEWRNLIILFLLLNTGAMIGPSIRDLKNVWVLMVLLIFIPWPFFTSLGLFAITLILINIILQIILISLIYLVKLF
ncbi:MAG: hypothetical protein WCX46_01275 [Candidatus Paceibacterota bacterium]